MLYPESNECRMVTSLDGFWNFKVEDQQLDPAQPLPNPIPMAVPASFNDQVIDQQIRNHDIFGIKQRLTFRKCNWRNAMFCGLVQLLMKQRSM